ncbi:MAG: CaiB/BaiF CoA-transferase family protein [Rhodoblastus sp.]
MTKATGPLSGVRIVEFAGIGPGPFACMLMSDMGADVIAIQRPGHGRNHPGNFVNRGRRTIELDLKKPEDVATAKQLVAKADILVEGFRPGVMEKLGLGPDEALKSNEKLVYARMTGWGQEGPLAMAAGHDINYVAVTGALDSFRARKGGLVSPLNLVGDYGGGALYLVMGALAALIQSRASGKGQVVDVAMCDGVASLITMFHALSAMGVWTDKPGENLLDGGAPFYGPFECKDGKYFTIGAIEQQFYAELLQRAGIDDPEFKDQNNRAKWPAQREKMEAIFKTKTRDEWSKLLEGTDACAMAVYSMDEAKSHPHLVARKTFVEYAGAVQPAPAPRFSRTPSQIQSAPMEGRIEPAAAVAAWS